MSVTAAALFETNFIILTYFFFTVYHAKAPIILYKHAARNS